MLRRSFVGVGIIVLTLLVGVPVAAYAQANSGIAGIVRDASGAVLPGVTVEASSPALIEKVRSVVTDSQGRYNIIELRPGPYTVTFTLPGFNTLKREGIDLASGFTATVNADLVVGAVEETVTVTGASPVVDTTNVRQQQVIENEVIADLPVGRSSSGLGQLIPGVTVAEGGQRYQDVGGLAGEGSRLLFHGSKDSEFGMLINGLPFNGTGSGTSSYRGDVGEVEEVNLQLGANQAEYRLGGVVMNLIPKEGGNSFSGTASTTFSNASLQNDNLTPELEVQGLAAANKLERLWDYGFSMGGPIKQDKLWFFGNVRYWGSDQLVAGVFHDSNLTDFSYTPNLSEQAHDRPWTLNESLRLTWQIARTHKLTAMFANQPRGSFIASPSGGTLATPEALTFQDLPRNMYMQANWTAPLTSRLLVEGGVGRIVVTNNRTPRDDIPVGTPGMRDTGLNILFGAPNTHTNIAYDINAFKGSLSYITGSHAFKVGMTAEYGDSWSETVAGIDNEINYTFLNGTPTQITLNATPRIVTSRFNPMLGAYVQDQWAYKRATINLGLRYDYLHASVPEQVGPAVRFLDAYSFPAVNNVPNWKDLSPRTGIAYDLFGNGRTALKASWSGYVDGQILGIAGANNPRSAVSNTTNRNWNDANRNFLPDCDLLNFTANGECGPSSNNNFGRQVINTFYDPAYLEGWGVRQHNWETNFSIQHELAPRVALNAGYFHRWYTDFSTTDNRRVTAADYDTYCITAPSDPRLPSGGGQRVCNLWDLNPSKVGQTENYVTSAKNFGGTPKDGYDGFDIGMSARLQNGLFLQGGISTGRQRTADCFRADAPLQFCESRPPLQTQVKMIGTYMLPYDFQLTGTFQSIPGPEILATYTARNAEIVPSLGRNLSSGANGTATVQLIEPGTLYGEAMNQLDLRVIKNVRVNTMRFRATFDLYNALNLSPILLQNNGFGSQWLRPLSILPGRLFKIGGQFDF